MRLVNYQCKSCGKDVEELFKSGEDIPEVLDSPCPECDSIGTLFKWNFKNNAQVQKFKGEW